MLGLDEVVLAPADTAVGSAGSTSASRQTWMSGGAVDARVSRRARATWSRMSRDGAASTRRSLALVDDRIVSTDGAVDVAMRRRRRGRACSRRRTSTTTTRRSRSTTNGQGNAHVSFAFAAHRAVVDVDAELGLIRVVEIATAQDVGRVLNPLQAVGQIEGGIAQGVGLAVMEEIVDRRRA